MTRNLGQAEHAGQEAADDGIRAGPGVRGAGEDEEARADHRAGVMKPGAHLAASLRWHPVFVAGSEAATHERWDDHA